MVKNPGFRPRDFLCLLNSQSSILNYESQIMNHEARITNHQ